MQKKQDIARINAWKRENVTRLNLEIRKDTGILERVDAAVQAGDDRSRQAYIIHAIEERLERESR